MTRRELLASLGVVAAGAALAACGDDGGGSIDAAVSCDDNGTTSVITQNHGHVLVVTQEDIAAGVDKTYDIMGTALHTHSVTITAAQFAMLAQNMSATTTSSVATSHSHGIVVMCA